MRTGVGKVLKTNSKQSEMDNLKRWIMFVLSITIVMKKFTMTEKNELTGC